MHCGDFGFFRQERQAGPKPGGWFFGPGGDAFGFGFFGPGGKGGGFRGGRRRMFEQGDLKVVILRLLEERPRHGYEIIKELEEKSGGAYSPSPGTVYPTLTMLEDLGYARATPEEGGRKIYEITDAGRAHLKENRSQVDDLFERIAQVGASFFGDGMTDVHAGMRDVARAVYANAPRWHGDAERLAKVRDILKRAAAEIEALGAAAK